MSKNSSATPRKLLVLSREPLEVRRISERAACIPLRSWGLVGGLVLAWLFAARPVWAGSLAWNAPAECPAPPSAGSDAAPGRSPEAGATSGDEKGANEKKVSVTVSERDGVWSAVIRAEYAGGAGERSLNAQSCAELNRAVLVALSLLEGASEPVGEPAAPPVESSTGPVLPGGDEPGPTELPNVSETGAAPFARLEPEGRRAPPAPPEQEEKREATKAVPTSDGRPPPESVAGVLGVAASLAGEGTEFATLGGELVGALEWNAYRARLAVGARLPWERVPADHDIELEVWFLTSHLDLCRSWGTRLAVSGCVGPSLERVSARAPGITDPRGASHWFPGAGASLGLRLSHGARLSWMTELRFNTRASRVRTDVVPWGPVFEIPAWSIVLLAGPEFRL